MRATTVAMLCGVLAIGAAALTAVRRQQGREPSAAARELLALFDEFDPLPSGGLPCVRVWLGHGSPSAGWLLGHSAGTSLLRTGDYQCIGLPLDGNLRTMSYTSWEPLDLAESSFYDEFDGDLGWFQRARALALRGDFATLETCAPKDLREEGWQNTFASAFAEKLTMDFADPRCSWQELLARHDRWIARFGSRPHRFEEEEHMEPNRAGVAALLRELATHPGPDRSHTPADLVFDLHHEFSPRQPDRLGDFNLLRGPAMPRERTRPADRVLATGLPCVPFLIAALGDDSPSRCVGTPRAWRAGSDTPVPFGTIAHLVLIAVSLVLALGLSWSHITQKLSGQTDTDNVG